MLTPKHSPAESLAGNLEFALKWEGVRLEVLTALFEKVSKSDLERYITHKPTGRYTRRSWFFYEWLTREELDIPDAKKSRSVTAIDMSQQFGIDGGELSKRHKVIDNLPGTRDYCPLVWRTDALQTLIEKRLHDVAKNRIGPVHPDIISRASAFLLLGDSKASFQIEGERPPQDRALRWGQAIGKAGSVQLSIQELERLQKIVIGDSRMVNMGIRREGSFIGEWDRLTQNPIPVHISARQQDLQSLIEGLILYTKKSLDGGIDPVIVAAAVAFGFAFIHPFEDGNGRIHRWLIHHILAKGDFNPAGLVFPISAAILRNLEDYKRVLEAYSEPLLSLIEWRPTDKGNVEVTNDTRRLYSFFDSTRQSEFLYRCVQETVEIDLPQEVNFLLAFDDFRNGVQEVIDMPERTIQLIHKFLEQGNGRLSKRARRKEFQNLSDEEILRIEEIHARSFTDSNDLESETDL